MSILDHNIKHILHHFRDAGRLNVLIALLSHANVRNRCYPSMRLIAKETGYALEAVNASKKWLEEHGAIEIVKYEHRVGDEKKIKSVRQNVYQLTGVIELEGKVHNYLYVSPTEISENETSTSEISPIEMEVVKSLNSVKESKGSKERKENTSAAMQRDQSSSPIPSSSVLAGENTSATTPTRAKGKGKAKDEQRPLQSSAKGSPAPNGAAALAAALNVTIAGDDGAFYGALAKKLLKGITCEDFPAYVLFVKDMAAREKWNFTPASLTGVGRLSLFVTWREEQAAKAERRRAMEEKVYAEHPYLDPANKPDPSTYIQGDVKDAYLVKLNSFLGGQK